MRNSNPKNATVLDQVEYAYHMSTNLSLDLVVVIELDHLSNLPNQYKEINNIKHVLL